MARRRVDTAPQFNVGADSVLIQQVSGSTSTIFEVKNAAGASVMAIDSSGATTATFAAGVGLPVGMITPFAGSTAPTGWFLCGGQEVAIASYGALYAVVGTTYGSLTNGSGGAGTTHFRLPDLRGRTVAGVDNMGGVDAGVLSIANTPGTITGAETVTLTSAQSGVPAHSHANTAAFTGTAASHNHTQDSHNHTQNSHNHTQDSHNHSQNSHNHTQDSHGHLSRINTGYVYSASAGTQTFGVDGYADKSGGVANATATNQATTATNIATTATNQANTATNIATTATNQSTSITPAGTVAMTNVNNTAANAASAVSLMQPTIVLNYIVRY